MLPRLVLLLFICYQAYGSVSEKFLVLELSPDTKVSKASNTISLYVSLNCHSSCNGVSRSFVYARLHRKLSQFGVKIRRGRGQDAHQLEGEALSMAVALTQKLVIDVYAQESGGFTLGGSLIGYRKESESFVPIEIWHRESAVDSNGDTKDALARRLYLFVDDAMQTRSTRGFKTGGYVRQSKYSVSWNDRQEILSSSFVGVSSGYPSYINGHFGIWGGRKFPVSLEISGMRFSEENRSVQLTAGWIFDRSGSVTQALSLGAYGFNERAESKEQVLDPIGRVLSEKTVVTNELQWVYGPSYTIRSGPVFSRLGAGLSRIGESPQFKGFFQLGLKLDLLRY